LKCSGEPTGCSRCVKQSLFCHYSIQKQMGRPPKKRLRVDDDIGLFDGAGSDLWADLDNDLLYPSALPPDPAAASDAFKVCPPVYCARVPKTSQVHAGASFGVERSGLLQHEQLDMLQPIPATSTPWPDYSFTSTISLIPSVDPSFNSLQAGLGTGLSAPQGNPQCTCLSYLYLCLSNLSTLSSFPITEHTLCSLYTAARTARSVIRCEVCPQTFATAMQNVMLLGTLLHVIADAWLRVSTADAVDLGKRAAPRAFVASVPQDPQGQMETYRRWLRQTVRRAIIGGPIDPRGAVQCQESPDLLSLIKEMEARQRRWHAEGRSRHERQSPAQQPSNGAAEQRCGQNNNPNGTQEEKQNLDESQFLCLRVVGSAKDAISKFGFEPHEYPDGALS